MKQPFAALLRSKIEGKRIALRVFFFRRLGMRIKSDVQLGRIFCEWPNKITIGNKCIIEDNVIFKTTKPFSEDNCIEIGERVFIGQGCEFNINTKIKIGDDCLIASNTTFVDTGHEISINFKINQQPCTFEEIIVADDVWIGTHCVILKGVTIGKGSIIGAGSIVNKSIPEYQLWAGTPARFIRNRV